jgi:hypothetical protein
MFDIVYHRKIKPFASWSSDGKATKTKTGQKAHEIEKPYGKKLHTTTTPHPTPLHSSLSLTLS